MQVLDFYPGDAAKGGDYLTGAAQRDIVVDPNEPKRPERIVLTDLYIEYEGRVCFGETSVRHMANLLGMFEGERVMQIVSDNVDLSNEVEAQRIELERLRHAAATAKADIRYIGGDGKRYETERGARSAGVKIQAPELVRVPVAAPENVSTDGDAAPEPESERRPPWLRRRSDSDSSHGAEVTSER